ncbi:hypothetical protein NJC40_03445 [Pseudomonas sp. 21LCFQ02]|uniref:hypothetical protein n=1 Tax=Pseudomonas sp. 21LCFQ02 TaxID=2957505 RepID=UPI00209BA981|nr:hypothetical protein [Pseudomonas sp. 21LCFQ02]MCO8166832.1 hypothetical protein [Pseudomonas sp. 21LCFQ02]
MALKKQKQVKHTDAKWVDFDEDTKIQIASIDNPAYQVALARARREINRNDSNFGISAPGIIEGEKAEYDVQCRLVGHHIIRDWSGVLDEDGNPLPFSLDNAEALLLGTPEAFLFVFKAAQEYATELRGELEETLGKSSPAGSGKPSSAAKKPTSKG